MYNISLTPQTKQARWCPSLLCYRVEHAQASTNYQAELRHVLNLLVQERQWPDFSSFARVQRQLRLTPFSSVSTQQRSDGMTMHFGTINQGAERGIKDLIWVFLLHSLSPHTTLVWLHDSSELLVDSGDKVCLIGQDAGWQANIATVELLEPEAILGLNGMTLTKVTKIYLCLSSPVITTNRLNCYFIIILPRCSWFTLVETLQLTGQPIC